MWPNSNFFASIYRATNTGYNVTSYYYNGFPTTPAQPAENPAEPTGYLNTYGEILGFQYGTPYGNIVPQDIDYTAILSNTAAGDSAILANPDEGDGVPGLTGLIDKYAEYLYDDNTGAGDDSILAKPDEGDGVPGLTNLIDKYAKYLYNV